MKNKILIFIIGFLVGAIVATGGFLIYEKTKPSTNNTRNQFPEGNPPQMMERNGNIGDMQTPLQKPEGEMGENSMQMPDENGQLQQDENTEKTKKQKNKMQEQNTNQTVETNI